MRAVRFTLVTMGLLGCGAMILLAALLRNRPRPPFSSRWWWMAALQSRRHYSERHQRNGLPAADGPSRKCLLINDENKTRSLPRS